MRWKMIAFTAPFSAQIETIFAASLLSGFAFSLLLFFATGRVRGFRLRGRRFSKRPFLKRSSPIAALPGLIPASIGMWLTAFGLFGLVLRVQAGASVFVSLAVALLLATVFSLLFALAFAKTFSGTAKPIEGTALLGSFANVSLTIPANGVGAIAYENDGKRHTIAARTAGGEELAIGHRVMVTHVRNGVATVEQF